MFSFHTCKMAYRFYFFMVYIPTLSTDFIYISFGVVCRGMHFFFLLVFLRRRFRVGYRARRVKRRLEKKWRSASYFEDSPKQPPLECYCIMNPAGGLYNW